MGTGGRNLNNEHVLDIINEINYGLSARQAEIGGIEFNIHKNGSNYEIKAFGKTWIISIIEKMK